MKAFILKFGRVLLFGLSVLMVGAGAVTGFEWLLTAGVALAGWTAPYLTDLKLRKAAKAMGGLLEAAGKDSADVARLADTTAAKKLEKYSGGPAASP
jgi:hypothetical protein